MNEGRPNNHPASSIALGCVGAALGATLGWLGFAWLVRQGIYAMVLPGAMLGIGAGVMVRHRSVAFSIGCGMASVVLGLFREWRHFPFSTDGSLGYFAGHLHQLTLKTLLLILLGGIVGFYLPFRRRDNPAS